MSIKSQNVTKSLWVAVATAAAAIVPMSQGSLASADETSNTSTNTNTSWRAKSVEDVKAVLLTAGTEYTVQSGDTLSTIAAATDETVDQIAKANGLSNIHFITVGETLKLHTAADQTADEAVAPATTDAAPQVVAQPAVETPAVVATDAASQPAVAAPTYSTAGNSYPAGQCTWFVKNALSWVGNNWGNASGWGASAAAAGRAVNGTPAAGAVAVFAPGQAGAGALGHVAVVDSVNSDGTITISEGNYAGMAYHVRTISAAGWQYIH